MKITIEFCGLLSIPLLFSACSITEPYEPAIDEGAGMITETVSDERVAVDSSFEENGVVCRYEKTIGSRIGKRTCRTKAEERAAREAAQEALERNAIRTDEDRIVTE